MCGDRCGRFAACESSTVVVCALVLVQGRGDVALSFFHVRLGMLNRGFCVSAILVVTGALFSRRVGIVADMRRAGKPLCQGCITAI